MRHGQARCGEARHGKAETALIGNRLDEAASGSGQPEYWASQGVWATAVKGELAEGANSCHEELATLKKWLGLAKVWG